MLSEEKRVSCGKLEINWHSRVGTTDSSAPTISWRRTVSLPTLFLGHILGSEDSLFHFWKSQYFSSRHEHMWTELFHHNTCQEPQSLALSLDWIQWMPWARPLTLEPHFLYAEDRLSIPALSTSSICHTSNRTNEKIVCSESEGRWRCWITSFHAKKCCYFPLKRKEIASWPPDPGSSSALCRLSHHSVGFCYFRF